MSSDPTRLGKARRPDGPIESHAWPERLEARVITPGDAPRLHGYDVEADLCVNYSFVETALLSLTGEPPDEQQAAAFEVALHFLAPLSVAHAPTHAAVLARICGARFGSLAATTVLALAERAQTIVESHAPFLDWLERWHADPSETPAPQWRAASDADRASVERLGRALAQRGVALCARTSFVELGRMPALLAALHFAGLKAPDQLQAAFVLASFTASVAEARAWSFGEFRAYPMNLPRFIYDEGDG
jgi:hypothetical protein